MDQTQDPHDKAQQHQQQQQQPSPPDEEKDLVENGDMATDSVPTQPPMVANGLSYPPADKDSAKLSMSERMMKIGRSCPCTPSDTSADCATGASPDETHAQCDCQGWRPKPPGMSGRVDTCACGHKLSCHGGPWAGEEFERRLRAAFRRDELLQDKGKLLDFDYDDEDIASLRKQIVPRDTTNDDSEHTQDGKANGTAINGEAHAIRSESAEVVSRRTSPMDITDTDTDGPVKHGQTDNSEDGTTAREPKRIKIEADDEQEPAQPANGEVRNSENEGEQANDADESAEKSAAQVQDDEDEVPIKKEKPAVIEERQGLIEFRVFTNDGTRDSMILLTGMKNLFQKQLPKMPREYIARLVYDRNHYSMAIVKAPLIVLGGITYRPFNHRKFAEIVFCAITSTEQVKGYGSHLMNHLKDYISENTDVQHFLTYADNYAIGYFKKQGFTKEITLDRSIWMGYIKDYEGGTIMQCTMVPRVKYLEVNSLLQTQRKAVITKIKEVSKSHIIYPGLQDFKNGIAGVDPMSVPGIKESGWDPLMDTTPRVPVHGPHYNAMKHIVAELIKDASSWPFLHPVDVEAVTDYYSYIKDPMDLSTLESNVDADVYENLDDFARDCRKIFDNCRLYNGESTPYVKCANKLEKVFKDKLKEWKEA